ncbi:MAG: hypothetical protein HYV77_02935 [Candidatus Wildermuthbacteria bacterium]|nr:hypothetical protein [Candidatus Wildermuthbacteria bacterium]
MNTNSKAQITFSPALKVAANTTKVLFIRAGISSTANAGETVVLGIDSASDISAGSATVSGNFPAKGNAMSAVVLTIGSVEVIEDGALVDSQPDVGDTDVPVNAFKVVVGSTEGVTVEQITVEESGSASLSDTKNVELYDVTKGVSLGTTQWTSDGKASWSGLNISLAKGETRRFKVMLDVIGGTGLTVNADLMDGSDVLMSVKGNTYGFYISPDGNDASDWTNSNDGLAANNQTIQSGSLTITKSNKSPATGNIAPANNQALAAFDFVVAGESVKVTSLQFSFDLTSGFVDGTDEGQITNVKLYDASGNLVAGPQDLSATNDTANSTTYEATVTFTDVLIIPVGTNVYTVKADIATTTSTGDALVVGVGDADSETTVVGMTSNNTITANPTASNVNGNTQTVAAGALTATTLTAPAARSIAAGSQDFIFMTGSLAATTSGEDVQATAVTIQNDPGSGTGADDVVNVEIWADLTSANSSRGDKYETKVTTTTSFDSTADDTADTIAFTLNPVITVKKGLFVDIAVVADLRTSADVTGVVTHTLDIDAVTASGASTGATVDVTPTGSGQAMTATTGGTLTVTVDASNPSAKLVLSGGSKEAVGVFRLAADNVEDLDLDSVLVTATGSQTDTIAAYYLYSDKRADGGSTSDPISVAPGGTTANFQIADGTVTIPANGYARLTVKADTQSIDGTAVQNADTVQVSIVTAGDVDTTGKASGGAVDSTETNVEGSIHKLYKAYPKFTVSSDTGKVSPATGSHLNGGSKQLVAIFKVEAVGGDDVTFQNADGNLVIFQITVTGDDDAGTETITFEDQDANTLDTGTITSASATTEITVDFSSNDLTVPMGEAKYIYVYADTSDLETDGNTLQVWLDNTAGDIDFGVNGANFTNSEGAIIFKGDILAGSLVNPS